MARVWAGHTRTTSTPTAKGVGARDLQTPRRRRRQQAGNDGDGDASSSSSEGETDDEPDDNLDRIHRDGRRLPDEFDSRRGWSDGADGIPVDWGMKNWTEELHVRDDAETWVTDRRAAESAAAAERVAVAPAAAAAAGTSSAVYAPPTSSSAFLFNYKQQPFVDIVVEHAHSVDACRRAERRVPPGSRVQDRP